jgi:hypothetical protein
LKRHPSRLTPSVVAAVAVTSAACNRGEERAGATAEKQAVSPVQQVNQPTTVVGCLRAGAATDTYVVTSEKKETGEMPATYELIGSGGANLAELAGQRVEVSGTLEARQQVATRSTTDPAPNAGERPEATGTGGTPAVSTTTKLDIKRIEVQGVRAVGGECQQ